MSSYSSELLQEKLSRLNSTQESIETLSLWIIHHKQYASTSISTWMEDMRSGNADRRLLLLYLANDVLQNGKRKGADVFMELFKDPLKESMRLISGQKIQTSVERMIRIWKERKIFKHDFLIELSSSLEPEKKIEMPQSPPKTFQLSLLSDAINEMEKFEGELAVKWAGLQALRLNAADPSTLMQLKDKSAGGRFSEEFEEASQKLQEYCGLLNIEADERTAILEMVIECMEEQKQFYAKVQTVYEEHKQLSVHVTEFLNKLHERQKELERAQSTSTSDPTAKEDITEEGDMEIDSGDESTPQPQQPQQQEQQSVTVTKQQQQQQQSSQEQLNTMAQTLQVFPNLLPAIQQQLQQQQQQLQQRTQQQQNSYIMPTPNSSYLTLLPTPAAAAATTTVRPAFTPMNIPQPRNLPPLLPPSLPAMPLTQPGLSSLNISQQLAPRMAPIQSSQLQQQVRPNQSLTPLPGNMLSTQQLSSVHPAVLHNQQQQQQPQVQYINNQQVLGTINGSLGQTFKQQVGPVPITSSLQPLPPSMSWPAASQSSKANVLTTSSADHTPLFLKAARASATVNIAPPVTHPPVTEGIQTQPLQSLPLPPVAALPAGLPNTVTSLITPYSQAATSVPPVAIVQPSSVPAPLMTRPIQTMPVTIVTTLPATTHSSVTAPTGVSTVVPTVTALSTTSTPSTTSSENALALASSLVPGLDTEVLQSILRTVKIGSGSKTADTVEPSEMVTDEQPTSTADAFEVDDGDPNIIMFGERKRKPSSEKEINSPVDSFVPDPKLAKVENSISKANIPPWLQEVGGASVNGPVSNSASTVDTAHEQVAGLHLASKDQPPLRPPLRPYFRDLEFDHGPPMKSQMQSSIEDDAPYSFDDDDYEPFDTKVSLVKDYGHGAAVSMDYNHGTKPFPGDQELSKGQESDQQFSFDDQDSGSESPDTDEGLFIKDQKADQELSSQESMPVKKGVINQESMEKDVLDQKPISDQKSTLVPVSVSYQGAPVIYQRSIHGPVMTDQKLAHGPDIVNQRPITDQKVPVTDQGPTHGPMVDQRPNYGPPITDQKPIHGPPVTDQRPSHGSPVTDQRPSHGSPVTDQRPSHGPPVIDQRPSHGPPMTDPRPIHGPPMTDQRPIPRPPITDQRPIHRPPMTDQRPIHGPPVIDQRPNQGPPIRDQIFSRGQEPYNIDQRHNQGFPVRDQGPPNSDHVPSRDYRFPPRSEGPRDQWPPVRHQGFPMRGQGPPVRFTRDHRQDQGEPGRDQQGYFVRDQVTPAGDQGPLRDQQPGQGPPLMTTTDSQESQENAEETIEDQALSSEGDHIPDQELQQILFNRSQEPHVRDQEPHLRDQEPHLRDQEPHLRGQEPHVRDQGPHLRDQEPHLRGQAPHLRGQEPHLRGQEPHLRDQEPHLRGQEPHVRGAEVPDSDQGHYRGHGPPRNSLEPNSEHHRFSHIPPPDHFDRPMSDKYYRPPWRPPMGPRRMSPPPFHHPPPRNMRFPPPHDSQWPRHQDYSPPRHPPPHQYGHAPPRLPPYRQPY